MNTQPAKYRGKISVIIPCYNEERVLPETARRVVKEISHYPDYEVLFINDGSRDRTPDILDALAKKNKKIRVLHFSRNFGHQGAVTAGLHAAKGKIAMVIDADLQDPPELFHDMIRRHLEGNFQVVYCVRKVRKGESFLRRFLMKRFYRFLNSISEIPLPLDAGDFRLLDRSVLDHFKRFPERNKYVRGLVSWIGFRQAPLEYVRDARQAGESKYSYFKLVRLALGGILYFSKKPLSLATWMGAASFAVGFLLAVYIVLVKLHVLSQDVPGWASIMTAIIFFGGVQLFSIGLIGLYLGSVFDEVKGRPEYLVARKTN